MCVCGHRHTLRRRTCARMSVVLDPIWMCDPIFVVPARITSACEPAAFALYARLQNPHIALRMVARPGCYRSSCSRSCRRGNRRLCKCFSRSLGRLMRQVDARKRAVAEAVTQRGRGSHAGPRSCWENKGMVLPRLERKASFEAWAYFLRYYAHTANTETSETIEILVDMNAWRSGVLAGIREQFAEVEVEDISAELFGLLVNSTVGGYSQAVKAVEDSQRLEARWRLLH